MYISVLYILYNITFFLQEQLAQSMFDHIPVGVGSKGIIPMNARDLEEALEMGMDWSLREGKGKNMKQSIDEIKIYIK